MTIKERDKMETIECPYCENVQYVCDNETICKGCGRKINISEEDKMKERNSNMNMKKLLGLFVGIGLFCFSLNAQAEKITIDVPDELYPYLVKTVDKINNEEIAKDSNYTLQTIPGYVSKIFIPVVSSYKQKIEDGVLEQAKIRLTSLSLEAQVDCLSYLDKKAEEESK